MQKSSYKDTTFPTFDLSLLALQSAAGLAQNPQNHRLPVRSPLSIRATETTVPDNNLALVMFYKPAGQGYKIVQPPVGVLVTSIPEGAANVTVNGAKYFEFGGIWYRPFYSGSDVVYQTVPNPTG